jgi:hypothetical protein
VDAQVGRGIAAVGVVLALLGIWLHAVVGQSYWDLDGTAGAFLLIMAILGALALLAGFSGGAGGADRALLITGAVLLGFYAFFPAALATDKWDYLDAGAWLGFVGGCLMTIGALAVLMPWRSAPAATSAANPPMGAALAALGLILIVPAIWLKVDNEGGSYWNAPGLGHSLGVLILILVILAGLGLVGAVLAGVAGAAGLAALAGLILCGLMVFIPVGDAFGDLGNMRAGAWLGFFGGLLLAIGVVLLSRSAMEAAPARTTMATPASTPPPAAT